MKLRGVGPAALLVLLLISTSSWAQDAPALMPMPAAVRMQSGNLRLTRHLRIDWRRYKNKLLERAVDRFVGNLNRRTGIDFVRDNSINEAPVVITIDCAAADANFLTTKADESYRLNVTGAGVAILAPGPTGVLRALATLLQLTQSGADGYGLREAVIEDHPRFVWRGIMIDVSRHFMPVKLVEHEMNAMEAVKLNVLHLHLSDSESFSIESKVYPLLQRKGAVDGRYYTQDEVRELVSYARDRAIRVVPEFDVPGHLKSWLAGYPELASGPGPYKPESDYADGDAALNPADEHVYRFLNRLFGEMAGLFPDQYFHVGGDEVPGKQWQGNAGIQKFMRDHSFKTKGQLQAYFLGRVNDILRSHGKTMIAWDEVLDGNIPKSVAVEAWRSSRMTAVSVKTGHVAVVAAPYYLDLLLPAGTYYENDPLDTNSWGRTEAQYKAASKKGVLLPNGFVLQGPIPLSPQQEDLVLGGEAQMWSETITPEMLDAGLWPRSAAIAERFWSPCDVKNVDDMYRRLYSIDRLLAVLGANQYANRQRMIDRMAPKDPDPLETLAAVVEPIRYLAHWHSARGGVQPDQNAMADAALPESLEARQFCDRVHALLTSASGDRELARRVTSQLQQWKSNDVPLVRSIDAIPNLQPLVEVSSDLRTLATIGLDALGFIAAKQAPDKAWVDNEHDVIQKQQKYADASSSYHDADLKPVQPASEVLIAVLPGIAELAHAAERIHR